MVGLVIVSHSQKVAEGIAELAAQMASDDLPILPAGGLEDGRIGTDAMRIKAAVEEADRGDGVVLFCDLGSAVMSAEMALEFLEEGRHSARIADAPILEGAVLSAVTASTGASLEEVLATGEEARGEKKFQ